MGNSVHTDICRISCYVNLCSPCQQRKCTPYWPENDTEGEQDTYGDVTVKITAVEIFNDHVIRVFNVKKGVSSTVDVKTFTGKTCYLLFLCVSLPIFISVYQV